MLNTVCSTVKEENLELILSMSLLIAVVVVVVVTVIGNFPIVALLILIS